MILYPQNESTTPSLPMVVSFGKSRCYSMKQSPLRIINSDCSFPVESAWAPNWMIVNSGRSNPSSYVTLAHFQTKHDCSNGMNPNQTTRISTWANLFLIFFSQTHSSIPMGRTRTGFHNSSSQIQSFPKKGDCQSHIHHTHRRNYNQSSVLSMRHNLANGIELMYHASMFASQP